MLHLGIVSVSVAKFPAKNKGLLKGLVLFCQAAQRVSVPAALAITAELPDTLAQLATRLRREHDPAISKSIELCPNSHL